jgi:hypothetical protein
MLKATRAALLLILASHLAGCVDVRSFAGDWAGAVVSEPAVRQGFAPDARVELTLKEVDLQGVTANLSTSDGRFAGSRMTRVIKAANDAIASLTFDGAPLRTYLLFAALAAEPEGVPASILISLFGDDHIELRILRGNDLFGVFNLGRIEKEGG